MRDDRAVAVFARKVERRHLVLVAHEELGALGRWRECLHRAQMSPGRRVVQSSLTIVVDHRRRGAEAQQQLALEVTELKLSVENLERERDFYYSKLREVEVLCQGVLF